MFCKWFSASRFSIIGSRRCGWPANHQENGCGPPRVVKSQSFMACSRNARPRSLQVAPSQLQNCAIRPVEFVLALDQIVLGSFSAHHPAGAALVFPRRTFVHRLTRCFATWNLSRTIFSFGSGRWALIRLHIRAPTCPSHARDPAALLLAQRGPETVQARCFGPGTYNTRRAPRSWTIARNLVPLRNDFSSSPSIRSFLPSAAPVRGARHAPDSMYLVHDRPN